jgi:hypothetical protein
MPPKKLNQQEPSAVPDIDELKSIAAKSDSPEDKLKEAAASAESRTQRNGRNTYKMRTTRKLRRTETLKRRVY